MAEETQIASVNFTLSRHELLVVLDALDGAVIPGLTADPLGELTPNQEQIARVVAQRAMLARGFIRMQEDSPALHRWIADAIATCAFAPSALMVIHRTPEASPYQLYAHLGEDNIVSHIPMPDALHAFAILPSKELLTDQIDAIVGLPEDAEAGAETFSLSSEVFSQVRDLVDAGDVEAAIRLLQEAGVRSGNAETFAKALGDNPAVTVFHWVHVDESGASEEKDFTVIRNGGRAWLLVAAGDQIQARAISKPEFRTFLTQLFNE